MTESEDKIQVICNKCKYRINHKTAKKASGMGNLSNHLMGYCKNDFIFVKVAAEAKENDTPLPNASVGVGSSNMILPQLNSYNAFVLSVPRS